MSQTNSCQMYVEHVHSENATSNGDKTRRVAIPRIMIITIIITIVQKGICVDGFHFKCTCHRVSETGMVVQVFKKIDIGDGQSHRLEIMW
eukprot:610578_1